jgi:bacterioferritin
VVKTYQRNCRGSWSGLPGGTTVAFLCLSQTLGLWKTKVKTMQMTKTQDQKSQKRLTREALAERLNEDLSREYQAIIAYVVYSQALKGAEYMSIAEELERHAAEELQHAITIARQVDYLGAMPTATALPVKLSDDPITMLRADLDNENETVKHYRRRVIECEELGEFAIAEEIREILKQEQEHQIDLATALGEEVPDVSKL